jgi:hypothetical protein
MRLLFPIAGGFALFILIGLAALAFNIWMLIDAARRPESDFNPPQSRVWWIVGLAVGLFVNLLGLIASIVYYVSIRKPALEGRPPAPLFGGGGGGGGTAMGPRLGAGSDGGVKGRTCTNCGEPLGTHARYCQNCGTPADLEG